MTQCTLSERIKHVIAGETDVDLVEYFDTLDIREREHGVLGRIIYNELGSRHPRRMRKYETTNLSLRQAILNEPFEYRKES